MPKELFDILQIKDSQKLTNLYDSLFDRSDLVNVNLKAEKALKSKAIVPDNSIVNNSGTTQRIKGAIADMYVYQKWFLLSKAILVSKESIYNKIVFDKLQYNEVEEEFAILEYKNKIETNLSENEIELPENEIELNARAICLAEKFIENENYRAEFSREGQFEALINEATKKDPQFIAKSNKIEITKALMSNKMRFYNSLENMHTEAEFQNTADSLRTQSQVDNLKAQNDDLKEQKTIADNEISAKQNIRTLQQERDSKSIFWKIFRPVSNLVNYVKLSYARYSYKQNYILPKLEEYKNDDNYEEKVANAVGKLNEEISSDRPLTSQVTAPKVYTNETLNNVKLGNEKSNDSEFINKENFKKIIGDEFSNEQKLDTSTVSQSSRDDIKIDLS